MDSKELIEVSKPRPPNRGKGGPTTRRNREKREMGVESAAIAYVQMENGEYKYSDGARKQKNEDGSPDINGRELMRRAGYSPGSLDHFPDYLATDEHFWELVELHRIRRTDPMFRKEQEWP